MCAQKYPEPGSDPLSASESSFPGASGRTSSEQRAAGMLARAAHELNTPLSIIAGYVEVLARETENTLTPRQKLILQNLQASTNRLRRVVQDFLAFSTLESEAAMKLEDGDLNACLREICAFWQERYRQSGVELDCRFRGPDRQFPFDFYRVQRVLSNLLDNALRFSPKGSTVQVEEEVVFWERRNRALTPGEERRRQENRASNAVRVVVSDAGPGVPPELLNNIFNEFVRATDSGDGVGLGLAIARRVVEAHGGRIWVESTAGAPTTFCFVLPFTGAPQARMEMPS